MQQNRRRRPTAQSIAGVFQEMMEVQFQGRPSPPAPQQQAAPPEQAPPEGLYIISVAARILAMHPQTLRKYERVGLVRPSRTVGMLRLYSEEDIAKLRVIKRLVEEVRLNLAGVEMAMAVFDQLAAARREMNRRATAQAFDRMFEQIMAIFEGSPRNRNPQDGQE